MNPLNLMVFLTADFSQMEIRVLAEISGDKLLISQLQSGQDIHCLIGNTLTGLPVDRIKSEKNLRKMIKGLVFGIIYGKGRNNLYPYVVAGIRHVDGKHADLTGISAQRLAKLYDAFFAKYLGVKAYIDRMHRMAVDLHYVETMFGFRREIRENDERGTFFLNQAVNSPIQGSAHTFLLIALALLDIKPRTYSLLQKCLMEEHDALFFSVRLGDLVAAFTQLKALFADAYRYAQVKFKITLRVPLLTEASAGFTMGSMVAYDGQAVEEFLPAWRAKQREVEAKDWEDLMPQVV